MSEGFRVIKRDPIAQKVEYVTTSCAMVSEGDLLVSKADEAVMVQPAQAPRRLQ